MPDVRLEVQRRQGDRPSEHDAPGTPRDAPAGLCRIRGRAHCAVKGDRELAGAHRLPWDAEEDQRARAKLAAPGHAALAADSHSVHKDLVASKERGDPKHQPVRGRRDAHMHAVPDLVEVGIALAGHALVGVENRPFGIVEVLGRKRGIVALLEEPVGAEVDHLAGARGAVVARVLRMLQLRSGLGDGGGGDGGKQQNGEWQDEGRGQTAHGGSPVV